MCMKILRVTSLGCGGGGAETGIVSLQPVLESMGHTVRTLASDCGTQNTPHFNTYSFAALSRQPFVLKPFYRAFYPASYRALSRVLDEYRPDIVQLHTLYEVSPSVLFALRRYPTVATIHGAEDYTKSLFLWALPARFFRAGVPTDSVRDLTGVGWLHYLYNQLVMRPVYRVGLRAVDVFVVMSEFMRSLMLREGVRSVCIPNACALFDPVPVDPSGATILYAGRLEQIKGVHDLIMALPVIRVSRPDATLVVVGTGPYEGELRKLAASLGVAEYVRFTGFLERDALRTWYERATVVAMPSLWPEPFGKVGIEAMSVGRPVVATDVGGVREWLADGETGYLVRAHDPAHLAGRITELLTDTAVLVRMGANAAVRARDFSLDVYARRIVALYEHVIASSRKHDR